MRSLGERHMPYSEIDKEASWTEVGTCPHPKDRKERLVDKSKERRPNNTLTVSVANRVLETMFSMIADLVLWFEMRLLHTCAEILTCTLFSTKIGTNI